MNTQDEEKGLRRFRPNRRRGRKKALPMEISNEDTRNLLFIVHYGKVSGYREVGIDLLVPYVEWLAERLLAPCALWEHGSKRAIPFFAQVVNFFSENTALAMDCSEPELKIFLSSRKNQIDDLLSSRYGTLPRVSIEDQVSATIRCIALWAMMEDLIKEFDDERILNQYSKEYGQSVADIKQGDFKVSRLIEIADLVPEIDDWVDKIDPKEEIPAKKINAGLLKKIANMEIEWTFDAGQHLKSRDGRAVSVFCMPCRLLQDIGQAPNSPRDALAKMGLSLEYGNEVISSYKLLFGPPCHNLLERLIKDETPHPLDPQLRILCNKAPETASWQKEQFKHLWPRIEYLHRHMREIQPDSFWKLLYRDRRDSLNWYTFIFAVIVLVLTFISTVGTLVQATKAFYPSNPQSTDEPGTLSSQPVIVPATAINMSSYRD